MGCHICVTVRLPAWQCGETMYRKQARIPPFSLLGCTRRSRAAKRGGFKRGCFPIWTSPSFFVLFLSFWDFPGDFPDLLGDGPGIFPICPFPLSRPIKSTYEEQSRKGPRHNLDLSRKKMGNTRVWNPPGLAFPNFCENLRPPNAGISRRRGESAKIGGFLRKSVFWALSVTLVPSP